MASASYVQSSFIGGLVSKWTQGRYHDPHYRTWMETCLNGHPTETESWVRRPGFQLCGVTKGNSPGKLIKFSFDESAPYAMELTDAGASTGFLRFWQSNQLVTTNDSVAISSISGATPAVVTVASAVSWSSGDDVFLFDLGTSCPTLQNRRLTITVLTDTTFSIADAISGDDIDGSAIETPADGAMVAHVLEYTTPYAGGQWANVRVVQTEQAAFLLHPTFAPQELSVDSEPTADSFATFSLQQPLFLDGPYLDPVPGSTMTASALEGVVTLTLGFQAYNSSVAYTIGDFVTSSDVGYRSLTDANVGNTPASSPTDWEVVGFGAAINDGNGFLASDVGRLVRLFSEPALWSSAFTYASGALVTFNPSGLPGEESYYQSLVATNNNNTPGVDATHWGLVAIGSSQNPALWTWGKITGLSATGLIAQNAGTVIGNMTAPEGGGNAAAFNGGTNQAAASSAVCASNDAYVGKNFGGSPETISLANVFSSTNNGFLTPGGGNTVTLNLRGSNSAPSSASNGTLLGTTGAITNPVNGSVSISSDSGATTYQYVWIEVLGLDPIVSQVYFYSDSASPGTAVSCEILGPALLYSDVTIQTWQLGLYSNTTGWPNVGTYSDGRLWLSSPGYPNRIDASVADGIDGVNNGNPIGTVQFAPTDQFGNVTDANGISYTFNAPDANPILWMIPDQQGIIAGTAAGEWLVIAPTSGGLSPTNIAARRATVVGCANIEPRRCEHTIVFVQAQLRKLMEYFADVFSGKFSAPNLTKDAKQLTIGNLQEIAYQQELVPIVWARVDNGLIGTTYKRDTLMTSSGPTMNGWHQHQLGSGREVTSLVVGSATDGTLEAPMIISVDPNAPLYCVEVLSPILDEGSLLSEACYLDEAIAPTSFTLVAAGGDYPYGAITLNGLWPLNGNTCTAWLGGLDCGDYEVSNGSITVPFGDGIGGGQGTFPTSPGANRGDQGLFTSAFVVGGVTANGETLWTGAMPMFVGFTYTSQGRIVRPNTPPESGARSGPAFGKKRRSQWIMAQFEGSQGVSWGTEFDSTLVPVPFRQADDVTPYTVDQQYTGIARGQPNDLYSFDSMLCWEVTRPYPCNVQAIGAALETQDL